MLGEVWKLKKYFYISYLSISSYTPYTNWIKANV